MKNAEAIWSVNDYSRIPYWLYKDVEVFTREEDAVFQGPVWNFIGFEAELPHAGDFKTTAVGNTPILINRTKDGEVAAFINRCGHRGAKLQREPFGNAPEHTCIYHRWCFSTEGKLIGVPFRRGFKGKGGLDADFRMEDHGLRRLNVAIYRSAIFVSFQDRLEPLEQYLGDMVRTQMDRIFDRPLKIMGYQRQTIRANWKLYQENLRDTYHASLLHQFFVTFGLDRVTNVGGIRMDERHRHMLSFVKASAPDDKEAQQAYADNGIPSDELKLEDATMMRYTKQYADDVGLVVFSVFPGGHFQQLANCLNARQIIARGPEEFEIVWTLLGYADDDAEMLLHRKRQANLVGPAGLVSMEDAEALEIVQDSIGNELKATAVIEMGGKGPIRDLDNKINDVPARGFWSYYAELMGIEPEGAVR